MQWINNLKIWVKVSICAVVPVFIMIGIGIWTFNVSFSIYNHTTSAKEQDIVLALTAQGMDKNIVQIQQWLTDISATRGLDGLNDGFDEAENNYQEFLKKLEVFKRIYSEQGNTEKLGQLDELKVRVDNYYAMGKTMAQAYVDGGPEQGNKIMGDFDGAAAALSEVLVPFIQANIGNANQKMISITEEIDHFKNMILVLTILAILISFFFSLFIITSITKPINTLKMKVLEIEETGDLSIQVDIHSTDEIGQTVTAFNKLMQNFHTILGNINENADKLATASLELSSTTTQIKKASEEINKGIDESVGAAQTTTDGIKQIAGTFSEISGNVKTISDMTEKIEQDAKLGTEAVQETQDSIQQIAESSREIVGIMDVITGIANQTNLLSLNAAIEAAKAGEFGKGFAVVADEVRNLAERSSSSVTEIDGLIKISSAKVKEGGDVVARTGEILDQLITRVGEISDQIQKVAGDRVVQDERIVRISNVNEGFFKINESNAVAMNEMTETMKEIEITSEDLSKMAEEQKDLISRFKL